jgi:hypothetical protein
VFFLYILFNLNSVSAMRESLAIKIVVLSANTYGCMQTTSRTPNHVHQPLLSKTLVSNASSSDHCIPFDILCMHLQSIMAKVIHVCTCWHFLYASATRNAHCDPILLWKAHYCPRLLWNDNCLSHRVSTHLYKYFMYTLLNLLYLLVA